MFCRDTPTHGWVCGWMGGSVGQWVVQWVNGWFSGSMGGSVGQWVGLGQSTKNLINLDQIEIIQFCLKIYDL